MANMSDKVLSDIGIEMEFYMEKQGRGFSITRHLGKYWWRYLIGLSALVGVDLLLLEIPRITGRVTDGLQAGSLNMAGIWQQLIYLLVLGLFIAAMRFAWRWFIFGTSRSVEADLRLDYFRKLEQVSTNFYNEQKTGDLMAYAINDLNAIRMMVGPGVLMALDALALTIFVMIRMTTEVSVTLTLFSIIPMPIIALGSVILGKFVFSRSKEKQEAFAHMSDMVQENISGMRVIKAFVKEGYEEARFAKANNNNYEKNMKMVKLFAFMMPMVSLISGLSIMIALGVGGRMAMIGEISVGSFVAFLQYLLMLVWPMMAFGWCINIFSQGLASLDRFETILKTPIDIYDGQNLVTPETIHGTIEVKNLTFSYKSDQAPVLKNISFKIKEGQTLGILGRTGSGKTTIANILLRLFNPPEGTVFLGGYDILTLPISRLRKSYGYVPQDNFLFSDKLSGNIAFSKASVDQAQVEAMAKAASVHENIIEFKEGYETVVGERGVTLSGGQKQRVSIARALMVDAPVLILDDAVSAVDTKTEEAILTMLREKRQDQTTIMIAHRISTLQNADHIIVLDEGEIIESGTHESLLEEKGLYYEMTLQQQLEEEIIDER